MTFHSCWLLSSIESMSPYRPVLKPASLRPLIAVVTHRRFPQMTGLELPRPAIGVFQSAEDAANDTGVSTLSETPSDRMPRNNGQSTPGRGATWVIPGVPAAITNAAS